VPIPTDSAPSTIVHIQLDDQPITPATVRFMQRALREAVELDAECLVIELNTPGGVLQSTQEFVTDMLGSRVPIVVYVSPSGARAASAGVFITLAGHVAAMAPGTRIGAAHPVQIGGLPFSPPQQPAKPAEDSSDQDDSKPTAMEQKLVNDTIAWAKSLAKLRDRNADWAAQAVSESSVLLAAEAVQMRVVDLEATDLRDLLRQIDGREVALESDAGPISVQLSTADATIRVIEMWWGERLLSVISDPNVALLLMIFGVYGILFEFYSPGWGVAGTLGVVSLVLGFFGLSVLPVNYAGLALILIALSLFAAEAFVTSYGALAIGGIVCLILGGTMLVDSPTGFLHVSLEVLVPIALATALITVFLVSQVVKAQRSRVQTGGEALVGEQAVAQDEFTEQEDRFVGQVHVHGEFWRALSPIRIARGQHVRVAGRDGLTLLVDTNATANRQPSTSGGAAKSNPTSEGDKS
jgi:membrane-bound serine protease (ClpP class)